MIRPPPLWLGHFAGRSHCRPNALAIAVAAAVALSMAALIRERSGDQVMTGVGRGEEGARKASG
jgi:hypothetical protein